MVLVNGARMTGKIMAKTTLLVLGSSGDLGLELSDLCPGGLQVTLEGLQAVMLGLSLSIWVSGLFAVLADDLLLAALFVTVEIHVFAEEAETAALSTRLHDALALAEVLHSFLIWVLKTTS